MNCLCILVQKVSPDQNFQGQGQRSSSWAFWIC